MRARVLEFGAFLKLTGIDCILLQAVSVTI
jgi:hypothetical protein